MTLESIHDHLPDVIHIQSLQRSKWTLHTYQFQNGLIFSLQSHNEISFTRLLLINLDVYSRTVIGKIFLYLSGTGFEDGSLFACFDGEDLASRSSCSSRSSSRRCFFGC